MMRARINLQEELKGAAFRIDLMFPGKTKLIEEMGEFVEAHIGIANYSCLCPGFFLCLRSLRPYGEASQKLRFNAALTGNELGVFGSFRIRKTHPSSSTSARCPIEIRTIKIEVVNNTRGHCLSFFVPSD